MMRKLIPSCILWCTLMASSSCEQSTYHSEPKVTSPLEPEANQPPKFHSSTKLPQLPPIKVTEINQWLKLPLQHSTQFQKLEAKDSFVPHTRSYERTLGKCSEHWTSFEHVILHDWPSQHAYTQLNFYMYDGQIEVVMMSVYQPPIPVLPKSSRWDMFKRKLGLGESHKTLLAEYFILKDNSLQPLDDLVRSKCTSLTHHTKDIGYSCENFVLSEARNRPHGLYFRARTNHLGEQPSSEQESLNKLWDVFYKPFSPLYVHDDSSDYQSSLVIYQNIDTLQRFIHDIAYEKRLLCPTPQKN